VSDEQPRLLQGQLNFSVRQPARAYRVCEAVNFREKQQVPPLHYAPVGMTILLVIGTVHPNRRLRDVRFLWLTRTQADSLTKLSSRPEESWAFRPTQGDEKQLLSSHRSSWKRRSPLCHPERSRGICSSTDHSWECFSTERSEVEGPAVNAICAPESGVIPIRRHGQSPNLDGTVPFVKRLQDPGLHKSFRQRKILPA
jgi:hypothetical protein